MNEKILPSFSIMFTHLSSREIAERSLGLTSYRIETRFTSRSLRNTGESGCSLLTWNPEDRLDGSDACNVDSVSHKTGDSN